MAADLSMFDPNTVGQRVYNIFGLPFKEHDAELVLLPVPWEATVASRQGTARSPEHIYDASLHVDLFDLHVRDGWKKGFYMLPVDRNIRKKSDFLRQCVELIAGHLTDGGKVEDNEQLFEKLKEINCGGRMMNDWVKEMTARLLKEGKKVGLLGGDHSTSFGFVSALSDIHDNFGILHLDAHADLHHKFMGFEHSHVSIMYNILNEIPQVSKLVQVGVRELSQEEWDFMDGNKNRVVTYFGQKLTEEQYEGRTWKNICEEIIANLPQKVYISFDIDVLDPKLCPGTCSPVPGGLQMDQVMYLIKMMKDSGRQLIGFDLCEVSDGDSAAGLDALYGARVLFKLCNFMVG